MLSNSRVSAILIILSQDGMSILNSRTIDNDEAFATSEEQ